MKIRLTAFLLCFLMLLSGCGKKENIRIKLFDRTLCQRADKIVIFIQLAAENDGGAGVLRSIDGVPLAAAVGVETLVVEHGAGQLIEGDALEEAGGDDAVSIHIRPGHGNGLAADADNLGKRHIW